jgi:membrane protease YdiL (CAAX protease family)
MRHGSQDEAADPRRRRGAEADVNGLASLSQRTYQGSVFGADICVMDIQVRCGFCGASNVSSAFSCSGCFMPLVDDMVTAEGAAVTETAPPPPPAAPGTAPRTAPLGPYRGPQAEAAATVAPSLEAELEELIEDSSAGAAVPLPGYRIGGNVIAGSDAVAAHAPLRPVRDPNRIAWRWYHIIVLAVLVWAVPAAVDWGLGLEQRTISSFLNRSLALQVVGYLIGTLAVAGLVISRQKGDWGTLGLGDDARQGRRDLLRGAAMGAAMFLGFLPIGLFTRGKLSVDGIVKVLLGSADGAGLVLAIGVVVVGAPVVEEIFFRGMLYEKLARKFPGVAVAVTSVLFMLVHGGIILPIFILGLAFGIRRLKGESVWFTIGAHAAWNASVVLVGLVVLTGGPVHFVSDSGTIELRYAKDWTRHENLEGAMGPARVTLALQGSDGSGIMVAEMDGINAGAASGKEMLKYGRSTGFLPEVSHVRKSSIPFDDAATAYELDAAAVSSLGTSINARIVAVVPPNSTTLYLFELDCMSPSCDAARKDFEQMLYSVVFNPPVAAGASR